MQKVVIHKAGGYDQLCLEEFSDAQPREGEVVIETKGIGVNYADVCVRWGVYESAKKYVGWPITPGFEFSGIIKKIGPAVTNFKPGDRVFGITRFGAYSSEICVSSKFIFSMPDMFSFEEAAGFPAVFMTAYHALFQIVRIPKNASILIHSAAGGVGTALLQLCRIAGFKTVGVVGASHKVETAKNFGANAVVDKSSEALWKKIEEIQPNGFDLVLDANGPETMKQSFDHLAPTGKLIIYGYHSMLPRKGGKLDRKKLLLGYFKLPKFSPFDLVSSNRSVVGFNISFLFEHSELIQEGMGHLLQWIKEGKIIPPTVQTFPLKNVADAHRSIESGQTVGKLILIP